MPESRMVSRRKFMLASGGAALLAAGLRGAPMHPACDALVSQASRCGALRLGYSSIGRVRPGDVESQHARQIAMMLSLWRPDPVPRFDTYGDLTRGAGETALTALMTTLTDSNGARVEIVTAVSPLPGPEMTFRGTRGTLQADTQGIRHTAAQGMPAEPAMYASEECWAAYCALRDSMCPSLVYARSARMILAGARERLMQGGGLQPC